MSSFIHIWDITKIEKCDTNHWTLLPCASLVPRPSSSHPPCACPVARMWRVGARRVGDETIPVRDTGSNPYWGWFSLAWPDPIPHWGKGSGTWPWSSLSPHTLECVPITAQYSVTWYLKYAINGKIQNFSLSRKWTWSMRSVLSKKCLESWAGTQ